MTRRSEIVREVYDQWERDWVGRTVPDPRYAVDGPSQYPEGLVALSAGPDADTDLYLRTQAALAAEGLS